MSSSEQRAHVDAILQAKRPETRVRRIGKAVEMVAEGLARRPVETSVGR